MSELSFVARRARRAAELGRVRASLRIAPAGLAWVSVLALVTPQPWVSASIAALVLVVILGLRWWRRALGRSATEGLVLGVPASLAGAHARTSAPGQGDWACGALCIVIGVAWALAIGITSTHEDDHARTGVARTITAATAALTAFAGCAGLGLGAALAAALATAMAWSGAIAIRRARAT